MRKRSIVVEVLTFAMMLAAVTDARAAEADAGVEAAASPHAPTERELDIRLLGGSASILALSDVRAKADVAVRSMSGVGLDSLTCGVHVCKAVFLAPGKAARRSLENAAMREEPFRTKGRWLDAGDDRVVLYFTTDRTVSLD